jgi:hypothetical protein
LFCAAEAFLFSPSCNLHAASLVQHMRVPPAQHPLACYSPSHPAFPCPCPCRILLLRPTPA